jgi:uncharacterized protein
MPDVRSVLVRLPARLLDGVIALYQRVVSPALTVVAPSCGCRFAPTCSHYARGALREHGVLAGLALTVRRLLKCGPWHPGGLDPVPSRRPSCTRVASSSPSPLATTAVSLAEAPRA